MAVGKKRVYSDDKLLAGAAAGGLIGSLLAGSGGAIILGALGALAGSAAHRIPDRG